LCSQVDFLLERVNVVKIADWRPLCFSGSSMGMIIGEGGPIFLPPCFCLAKDFGDVDQEAPEDDERAGGLTEMHGRAITVALRFGVMGEAVCVKLEEHMAAIESRFLKKRVPAVIELPTRLVRAAPAEAHFLQHLFKTYKVKTSEEIIEGAVQMGNIELVELLMAKADLGEFKLDLGALGRLAALADTDGMREALKRKVWAAFAW
jgi:hypothetical protein